jgi:hypothetical protein
MPVIYSTFAIFSLFKIINYWYQWKGNWFNLTGKTKLWQNTTEIMLVFFILH